MGRGRPLKSSLKFEKRSIVKMRAEVEKIIDQYYQKAASNMLEQAVEIMHASGVEVPRDTRSLRNSRHIYRPVIDEKAATVVVKFGYGGPNDRVNPLTGELVSSYMVDVHENPFYYHEIGKFKFLEDPIRRANQTYAQKLAEALGED